MMYDELIKRMRELASIPEHCEDVESCDQCPKEDICISFTNKQIIEVVTQAADAIEELRKAVLRLEDESGLYDELPTYYIYPTKWISVAERLPETRTRCVTISRDGDYGLGVYTTDYGWMFPYYMGETTHWMPLPEPPKEGE